MKARAIKIFLTTVILIVTMSCTRNNGDIGPLFGIWRMTSVTKGGEEVKSYKGNVYFMFQSTVHMQKYVYEDTYEYAEIFAAWRYEGENSIILDFSDPEYAPLAITGMEDGVNLVDIVKLNGDDMVLSYISVDGVKYVYTFKKW